MTSTLGQCIWYDHLTRDPAGAVAFYTEIIGWKSQPFGPGVPYTMFLSGQGPLAGAETMPGNLPDKVPPQWKANIHVADVDATVAEVKRLGGRVLAEAADYPDVGRLAVITDPQGLSVNVFAPTRAIPPRDATKPGEFMWSELMTTDHEAAFAFYSAVFGWKKKREMDMGRLGAYLIFSHGDEDLGGMFTKPKDVQVPSYWLYYIHVADLDDTIERARTRGAKVVRAPQEVPGGARVAMLLDPQGASFGLHGDAPQG
jgi:predicted enzyme related to lactoylglutathione lyase